MKLVPILASIVTSFAMLATVVSSSASALDFYLSGTFAATDLPGAPPNDPYSTTGLENGSFNGTFSYSGGAVPNNTSNTISSFSINFLNASNTVVDTFNSSTNGDFGEIARNSDLDQLIFGFTAPRGIPGNPFGLPPTRDLQLFFPVGSQGEESLLTNISFSEGGYGRGDFFGHNSTYLSITSATSTAVPEPSTIAGTILGLVAALFKYKKLRAF